ncbi:hypothetical protein MXD62_27710 [Frankia sp. Mgl5]|uniref:hypothetical protein n=1 Tax=Frankia sp. Mgl5 TaxID=2933793 RepID=UPI00200C41F7|nr:hypothetical protein [Frankia sp. Mgl5]MCK9930882.1 hypothetical protein [Frankia sp. Mgl5]
MFTRPGEQVRIAVSGGREGCAGQQRADRGEDRGDVQVLVGVDAENDFIVAAGGDLV